MWEIKNIEADEIEKFWSFLNTLDTETNMMMYEPHERDKRTNDQELRREIEDNVINGNDFLQIAIEDNKIIGYVRAERGKFNRISHSAYIVIGILNGFSGKGIGTKFFKNLDVWAKENNVIRLELTVECHNKAAIRLYEKSGFKIEGIKEKSMRVNGVLIDEYYMAKINVGA